MDDLVKRLRKENGGYYLERLALEAADRIEALEAALRHCANAIAELEKCKSEEEIGYRLVFGLEGFLFGALDNARAALGEKADG
jgi:prefoldin subunit 5